MSILMSIHAEHLANIYAGKKTIELRKNKPKRDHRGEYIYFYECGPGGCRMITGRAKIDTILPIPLYKNYHIQDAVMYAEIAVQACVTLQHLLDYEPCHGWKLYRAEKLDNPVPLAAIGLTRPPQSWQYIWSDKTAIIRRRGLK